MGANTDENDTFLHLYAFYSFNLRLSTRFRSGLDANAFT